MLPFVASQVFSGAVAELLGSTRALTLGFVIFSLSCLVAAIAPTLETFLLARMLQGLGGGIILPVGMAMAAAQVAPNRTATAIGGIQGAFATGLALGPGVAGLFAEHLDWRGFFGFLAAVGALAAVLIWIAYPAGRHAEQARRNPLKPLGEALSISGVRAVSAAGFLLLFSGVGATIFIAVWLQSDSGLTGPAGAGLLLAIPGLVGIVIAPLAGFLGDRWGVARTLLTGMVVTFGGLLGIFVFPGTLLAFPAFLLLMGIGNTATTTNLGALSLMQWPHLRQAVSGVFNGSRFLGLAVAPLIMAPVYEAHSLRGVLVVSAIVLAGTAVLAGRVAAPRRSGP